MTDKVRRSVPETPPAPADWHSFEVGAIKITREPYKVNDPSGATTTVTRYNQNENTGDFRYEQVDEDGNVIGHGWYAEGEEPQNGEWRKESWEEEVPVKIDTHGYIKNIVIVEEDADGNPIDRSNPLYPAYNPFTEQEIKDLPEYDAFKNAGYALAVAAHAKRKAEAQ